MAAPLDIRDLQNLPRRRVPKMFFDYADSGSWTESTYRANEADFGRIKLRQRVLVDMADRSLASTMIGQPVSMPVVLAPTGLTGMQHADGEILAAQAAEAFGVPFTLSTMSICSIEDVAAATTRAFWFQLYVMRDRGFVASLIDRAKAARCSALVLTLDLQILGQRHKDLRNGLSAPPKFTPRHVWQMATRPRWCVGMLRTKRRSFGNIVGHATNVSNLASLASWTNDVVSTGTWVISMAIGGRETRLDPERDALINVSAYGDPVPSARFMGGREWATLMAGRSSAATSEDRRFVLERGIRLLPAVESGSGPFAGSVAS